MGLTRADLLKKAAHAASGAMSAEQDRLKVPRYLWQCMGGKWTCPECGETSEFDEFRGSSMAELPPCRCIRTAAEHAREAFMRDHWAEAIEGQWEAQQIPVRFKKASFANFKPRTGAESPLATCKQYAEAFAVSETQEGLLLVGGFGAGKTHLAVATARRITERILVQAYFTSALGLLAAIKASFKRGRDDDEDRPDLIERAKTVELLILDDLGQELGSEFDRATLFDIVNYRYEACLPMIITSNQGDKQLRDGLGGALVSRLYEACQMVPVKASDYRVTLAAS